MVCLIRRAEENLNEGDRSDFQKLQATVPRVFVHSGCADNKDFPVSDLRPINVLACKTHFDRERFNRQQSGKLSPYHCYGGLIMKKKTLTIIIALACAVVLALGCFAVQALTLSGRNAADVALNDADPFEQNRDASEYYYYWTDENDPNSCYQIPWAWDSQDTSEFENSEAVESDTSAVYGKLYAEANDEQKRMIENIECEFGGFNYDYKKKILQIMGRLPSDTPILTVEQARAICAEVNDMGIEDWWEWRSELDRRLCAVTGAPDYEGGSGIGFTVYYLNSEHTRYLQVTIGFAAVFDAATHTVVEYITEPIA